VGGGLRHVGEVSLELLTQLLVRLRVAAHRHEEAGHHGGDDHDGLVHWGEGVVLVIVVTPTMLEWLDRGRVRTDPWPTCLNRGGRGREAVLVRAESALCEGCDIRQQSHTHSSSLHAPTW